jgi:hypothetical protein
MSLAIAFVSIFSLIALVVVGGAAYVEMRPMIQQYRQAQRHKRMLYADETMRVYTTVRFARARQGDHTGALASLFLSVLLLGFGTWEWSRFDYGGEWHTVQGQITSTVVKPDASSNTPQAIIEFRYTVGSQSFSSHWIDTPEALLAMTGVSADFEHYFRPGAPITVWYHPLLPTFPSLGRVTLWYVVVALGSGGFLLLSSGLTLLFARRVRQTVGVV